MKGPSTSKDVHSVVLGFQFEFVGLEERHLSDVVDVSGVEGLALLRFFGVVVGLAVGCATLLVSHRSGRGVNQWVAVEELAERLAEVLRQEGVQNRVDTRVHVSQAVRRDLQHDDGRRLAVDVEALQHQ